MAESSLDRASAFIVFLASAVVYGLTIVPTVSLWDSAALVTSSFILGIVRSNCAVAMGEYVSAEGSRIAHGTGAMRLERAVAIDPSYRQGALILGGCLGRREADRGESGDEVARFSCCQGGAGTCSMSIRRRTGIPEERCRAHV